MQATKSVLWMKTKMRSKAIVPWLTSRQALTESFICSAHHPFLALQSILDEFVHQQETRLRPLTDIVADAAKEDAKAGKSTVQPSHRLTHDLEHDGEEEYAQAGATDEKLLEAIPYKVG